MRKMQKSKLNIVHQSVTVLRIRFIYRTCTRPYKEFPVNVLLISPVTHRVRKTEAKQKQQCTKYKIQKVKLKKLFIVLTVYCSTHTECLVSSNGRTYIDLSLLVGVGSWGQCECSNRAVSDGGGSCVSSFICWLTCEKVLLKCMNISHNVDEEISILHLESFPTQIITTSLILNWPPLTVRDNKTMKRTFFQIWLFL